MPTVELTNSRKENLGSKFKNIFTRKSKIRKSALEYDNELLNAQEKAVTNYLEQFSREALQVLTEYEKEFQPFISFPKPQKSQDLATKSDELQSINDSLKELEKSKLSSFSNDKPRPLYQQEFLKFLRFSKYFILTIFWSKFR